ncbi:MAG: PIN domain-containing protein [Acidimicrobiales bacterium]
MMVSDNSTEGPVLAPEQVVIMQFPSRASERPGGALIFVEVFRLLFVLGGSAAGFEIGRLADANRHAPVTGLLLGAAISYVIGGVVGRLIDRGLQHVIFLFRNTPPGETFAASIISTTGMLLGLVIGLPVLVLVRSGFSLVIVALVSWVLATLGWRLGQVKGRQIVTAAGLTRILSPKPAPVEGHALLVDSSAVMDRYLLVLGRHGLLPGGLVVPNFVLDHVRAVSDAPDEASSRRARRGLESIEVLREQGVPVHLARDEVPEVDDPTIKLLTVARRAGLPVATCSSKVVDEAYRWEVAIIDLREIAHELTPDHLPGDRLFIELIREGRQPRQAVGYLPDGDMVVVNDAIHLIDQGEVALTVLSTRQTSQGVMVFAKLDPERRDKRTTTEVPLRHLA